MSTSKLLQTDGSTEITNRMISNYLRCYCNYNQSNWAELLPAAEYTYNSAPVESMAISPFETDQGWQPASSLDLLSRRYSTTIQNVTDLKVRLASTFNDTKFAMRIAQARQPAYNQKCYMPPNCTVGDNVFLSRKLSTTAVSDAQLSQKIGVKRYGPFKSLELIGDNAVRLQLPNNIHTNPVIHVEHTNRAHRQPAAISNQPPPQAQPFIDASGELVIEVERVLAHRRGGKGFQFLTLFKWAPNPEAEWKPLREFVDADGTITAALHSYTIDQKNSPTSSLNRILPGTLTQICGPFL